MPCFSYNSVTIAGKENRLEILKRFVRSKESKLDFEKIVPMPTELIESRNSGESWYDWRWQNWGTKWNAQEVVLKTVREDQLIYSFITPWEGPWPVLEKLSALFPDLIIEGGCSYDSDFSSQVIKFSNGEIVATEKFEAPE